MNTALIALGILAALIGGFFAGRWHGMSHRSKQLSEELEQKEEELEKLKSGVDDHFSETARLFSNLTDEYKSLYKHLAKGATELSNETFKLALTAPTEQLIDHEDASEPQQKNDENAELDLDDAGDNGSVETDNAKKSQDDGLTEQSEDSEKIYPETQEQPVDYARETNDNADSSDSDTKSNKESAEPKS